MIQIELSQEPNDQIFDDPWEIAYVSLCFLSLISSLIIPTVYFRSKKTRHHPAM